MTVTSATRPGSSVPGTIREIEMFQGGCGIAHLFPKERNIKHHARNRDEYAIEAYPVPHSSEGEQETLHLSSSEIWNASCDQSSFTCQVSIAGDQGPAEWDKSNEHRQHWIFTCEMEKRKVDRTWGLI